MITLKLVSVVVAISAVLIAFISKFYKKNVPIMIYGGEDERKITLKHEKKIEEIKRSDVQINSKEDALKELNRKPDAE